MRILLLSMILLSQYIFCMNPSLSKMQQYENQGIEEILRGHPELLKQIQQNNSPKSPRKNPNHPSTILKGSTEKINDNK